MRKATSLLLTLCMVFALCACGSGGGSVSSNREKDLDPLCVEDVSFEPDTSDSYNMRIKVRNNDISPLVTYDVELYLRCAKAVAEQTDKPLVFSISTNLPGYDQIAVKVR